MPTTHEVDAVVIGAGFSGLYSLYALRKEGFSTVVLEAGSGIGGTWYHNRYPGARCDIESLDYSYSFDEDLQQEWRWSEKFASQPEILAYIDHVAERFDLRKDVRLDTRVVSAVWDEDAAKWTVTTEAGDRYVGQFVVAATGVLNARQVPRFDGLDDFEGEWYHTADWPREGVEFAGKRVIVVGTGSSGTQIIPIVAAQADHLTVLQRTPNFTMPTGNAPYTEEMLAEWKADYAAKRRNARASNNGHNQIVNDKYGVDVSDEERAAEFEKRWNLGGHYMLRAFRDILVDEDVNNAAADWVRAKIASIVEDPETAAKLMPRMYLGTKRLCTGTNYYETYNRPNVDLIDVKANPIVRLVAEGIELADGTVVPADIIVFATGFDAMTGSLSRIDVRGRGGRELKEHWKGGPLTYVGLGVSGFPNFFVMSGPGSPSVTSNMVTSGELHVEWVRDALVYLREHGYAVIEATPEAEAAWVEHVADVASRTLYAKNTNSWFYGANTPGKAIVFQPYLGGVGPYGKRLQQIAAEGYPGFTLTRVRETVG